VDVVLPAPQRSGTSARQLSSAAQLGGSSAAAQQQLSGSSAAAQRQLGRASAAPQQWPAAEAVQPA
jgi:hypothetical protein